MTIFSRIIRGEIPCYKVAEDDQFFAFLDINPLVKGHTLVIPKLEVAYIFDMKPELLGDFMKFAQKVAESIKKNIDCKRVAVVVLGLDVPHAHIHLIPLNDADDINFNREKLTLSKDEFENIARIIEL